MIASDFSTGLTSTIAENEKARKAMQDKIEKAFAAKNNKQTGAGLSGDTKSSKKDKDSLLTSVKSPGSAVAQKQTKKAGGKPEDEVLLPVIAGNAGSSKTAKGGDYGILGVNMSQSIRGLNLGKLSTSGGDPYAATGSSFAFELYKFTKNLELKVLGSILINAYEGRNIFTNNIQKIHDDPYTAYKNFTATSIDVYVSRVTKLPSVIINSNFDGSINSTNTYTFGTSVTDGITNTLFKMLDQIKSASTNETKKQVILDPGLYIYPFN